MKLRPENFEPPYPAFTCELSGLRPDVTMAQIALQYRDSEQDAAVIQRLKARIEASLDGASGPWRHEPCTHVDAFGYRNDVVLAYWRQSAEFQRWRRRSDVAEWADAVHPIGLWIEALTCPVPQMETSYSTADPQWGLAPQCPVHLDQDHGYFGSMRDRMPAAEDEGLPGELTALPENDLAPDSLNRRLTVELPDNLCFIRTVQGWRDCDAVQRQDFHETMLPVYRAGVAYLRDNPRDTNCVSVRLVDMLDGDGQVQTQTLAWFLGLKDLERWAHEHPTHHAILNGMAEFAQRYELNLEVVLGHEVYVPPRGGTWVEYSNCHPATGFLRFLPAQPL